MTTTEDAARPPRERLRRTVADESLDQRAMRIHREAVDDTGDAYRQFHGWVLLCSWCDFETSAKTKTEALANMQAHYDDLDKRSGFAYGKVIVHA